MNWWNIFQLVACVTGIVGLIMGNVLRIRSDTKTGGLESNSTTESPVIQVNSTEAREDTFFVARVLMGVSLFCFYFRILHFYFFFLTLGPVVTTILKLVLDKMSFIFIL